MLLNRKRVYLASRSPRRRDLLKQIGLEFELLLLREGPMREADVDERYSRKWCMSDWYG